MNKLELLRTFVRVSELSSFTLAAESLGLPRSSVSEQVQALEALLGARLFNRTTRRVQATQDGLQLYERSKDLLARMDELEGLFRTDAAALSGRLRIDLPTLVARRIILPNLPQFVDCHPGLPLEVSCTDRQVDLLREGFDCVLRIGTLSDLNLVARTLGFEYEQDGTTRYQAMPGVITVNSTEAYESVCLAGLGIIQAPAAGLREYLERGELVPVLEAFNAPPMPVSLLYAAQLHLPQRVRAFMDWLVQLLEGQLDPVAGGR